MNEEDIPPPPRKDDPTPGSTSSDGGKTGWSPPSSPPSFSSGMQPRGEKSPMKIITSIIIAVVVGASFLSCMSRGKPNTGTGSCWADGTGNQVFPVSCSDPQADYVATYSVANEENCPTNTEWVIDGDKPGQVLCLRSVR